MMMQHTRKNMDREVDGQCGNMNQGTAHKGFHFCVCSRNERPGRLASELDHRKYYEIILSLSKRSAIVKILLKKSGRKTRAGTGSDWLPSNILDIHMIYI